jgi:hypothetical protein
MDKHDEHKNDVQVSVDPGKTPILYTDSVFLNSNKYGIVFDVAQTMSPGKNQVIVARIGMSREHAKMLLDVLGKHLALTTINQNKQ